MNIVLDEAIEITQRKDANNKKEDVKRQLGTLVIRGSSVVLWENIDKVE